MLAGEMGLLKSVICRYGVVARGYVLIRGTCFPVGFFVLWCIQNRPFVMYDKLRLITREAPASTISTRLLLIALDSASTAVLTRAILVHKQRMSEVETYQP
jgi:hypothetical protein